MVAETAKGSLIVFEGIDGSGKSTQAQRFAARMCSEGIPCHATTEPTDRPIGKLLRQLLTGQPPMDERVMARLFAADRLDHVLNSENGLLKKSQAGTHIVSDRHYLSSYAYQSVHMPLEEIIQINEASVQLLRPACHVFINISPETALTRLRKRQGRPEVYETLEWQTAIRQRFFDVFKHLRDEETILIVNGERSEDEIAADVWRLASEYLGTDKPHYPSDELVDGDIFF